MDNEPGYFTNTQATHQSDLLGSLDLLGQTSPKNEDLNELNITLKDLSDAPYLQQISHLKSDSLKKASYKNENVHKNNLESKGTVTIENATYKDILTNGEFVEFLKLLFSSQHLLLGDNLSKTEEKMKKKLCTMLIILNWGPRDSWTQARLIRSMEDRVYSLCKIYM